MLYALAIILPPLAVLMAGGRPFQALLNCVLTLFGWIPGVVHAFLVVGEYKADQRMEHATRQQIEAQRRMEEARARAAQKAARDAEKRAR
jgi:uncharacterized membrane protein YqaE (UPF0057 family)